MGVVKAQGVHYFGLHGYPITVVPVRSGEERGIANPWNLTEIAHSHNFVELVLITQGQGLHWLEGKDYQVSAGDVFVLQGRQRHFFHERQKMELVNVLYDANRIHLPLDDLRKLPGFIALFYLKPHQCRQPSHCHLDRTRLAQLEPLLDIMMRESSGRPAGHEALLLCKLIELIVFLARQYEKIETKDEFALLRIGRVISALESDFQRSWTIDALARLAHLSASQLNRVFRQATGQTPIDYLIKLRLQQAMRLLRTSELTMTQIANQVGFDDSNYFSRQFRKVHKISPSRYRQQTRQAGVTDGGINTDAPLSAQR